MPTNPPAILVVGGAGFIGSHMVLALQAAGYNAIVLDNLSKGHKDAVITAPFVHGDMGDKKLLSELFAAHQFIAVMHFASFIEVAESVKFPAKYYQNNVAATLNLLDVMIAHKVKNFIFSSTAAVYGEPQYIPIDENHPIAPINPYGKSKWMVEEIIKDYAKNNELTFAILRYFNAAGADPKGRVGECHEPESHLIPIVLQVAKGLRDRITVYGRDYATPDGTCVRDYVHVTDLCDAHLLALQALLDKKENLLCNLGTGRGYSVQQVIDTVKTVTKCAIPVSDGPRRLGDPAVLVAEVKRAEELLGWKAKYPNLEIIVQHAWEFIKHKSH